MPDIAIFARERDAEIQKSFDLFLHPGVVLHHPKSFLKDDGDPAANNGGWQWSAGTGTDTAPYFHIFNPILQGKKHDTDGEFIAKWVPELKGLPKEFRHEPWEMDKETAQKYNFKLGRDHPQQIVDHFFARDRTLDIY